MKVKRNPALYDPARDGVTFSLLSTFLDCREKAKLYLQGWSGTQPNFHLVFGGLAHAVLRAAYTQHRAGTLRSYPKQVWVSRTLERLRTVWVTEHPRPSDTAVAILEEALAKANIILPYYFLYWKRDFEEMRWIQVEETFRLPWSVTMLDGSTRSTFLRGRIDGAYVLPNAKRVVLRTAPRLLETKTRNSVDEDALIDTMPFERQTNIYLTALRRTTGTHPPSMLLNVIRKPLLRQKQKESWPEFETRIRADVQSRMDWYFMRMNMDVDPEDIDRNEGELNALIQDFVRWWYGEAGHYKNSNSCRPLGFGPCPYLKVCGHNDYVGLERRKILFRELEDE